MPFWFFKEMISFYFSAVFLVFIIIYMFNNYGLILTLPFALFFGFIIYNGVKNIERRRYGIKLEKEAYIFLKENTNFKIDFRKKMKYGDIDIYFPELDLAVDVKAYKTTDKRIFSKKNLNSYKRQRKIAKDLVIWLPNANKDSIQKLKDFWIVSGKYKMIEFLNKRSITHNKKTTITKKVQRSI